MFVIKWTSLWTITNLIYCIQKIALFSTEHLGLCARTVTWAQGFINECQPQAGGPDWFVQTARSRCRFISCVGPRHNRHKPINVDQCGGMPWRSFVRGRGGRGGVSIIAYALRSTNEIFHLFAISSIHRNTHHGFISSAIYCCVDKSWAQKYPGIERRCSPKPSI